MLQVGERVDRYVVEARLGEGGMAAVYRVRHAHLGTVHALKVLLVTVETVRKRLLEEGQIQARLRHPNIVAVTDVLMVHRSPALVLEYVDGPALDEWLDTHRPTIDETLSLFRGIVRGVGAAHAAGVVHRDLKPANVLLERSGGGLVPKVVDFGLVKTVGADRVHTQTGAAIGTPGFMAPEQIRDPSGVDQRADLWALGCMLYELVCGQRTFPMDDTFDLFEAVRAGRYDDPAIHAPDAPERVLATIRALLVVDPDQRLGDAPALWTALWDDPVPADLLDAPPPPNPIPPSAPPEAVPVEPVAALASPAVPAAREGPRKVGALVFGLVVGASVLFAFLVGIAGRSGPEPSTLAVAPVPREIAPEPAPSPPTPTPSPPPAPVEPPPVPVAVPVVVPRPRPQPVVPAPPTPEPTVVAAAFEIEGDASAVWLESAGRRVSPGEDVPPGTWEIRATFGDRAGLLAGEISTRPGEHVRLRCSSFVFRCTRIVP